MLTRDKNWFVYNDYIINEFNCKSNAKMTWSDQCINKNNASPVDVWSRQIKPTCRESYKRLGCDFWLRSTSSIRDELHPRKQITDSHHTSIHTPTDNSSRFINYERLNCNSAILPHKLYTRRLNLTALYMPYQYVVYTVFDSHNSDRKGLFSRLHPWWSLDGKSGLAFKIRCSKLLVKMHNIVELKYFATHKYS